MCDETLKAIFDNPVCESLSSNNILVNAPGIIPTIPSNIVTSISDTNLIVDWDVSMNATGYDVYSSDDPYGDFTFTDSVSTNQYIIPIANAKLFYYIIATNEYTK